MPGFSILRETMKYPMGLLTHLEYALGMKFTACFIKLIFGFWLTLYAITANAAESELVDTGEVNAQLISDHDDVAPGQEFQVALRTLINPEWHTYWLNPGDSGEPVQIRWDLPDELTAGAITWPLPKPIPTGPLTNYGFENEVFFPVDFKLSESARPGDVLDVKADVFYLVCREVCVPEDTQLSFSLLVGDPKIDENWMSVINFAVADAPQQGLAKGGVFEQDGQAVFRFTDLPEGDFADSYFFPEDGGMIEHAAPQKVTVTDKGLQLQTKAGFKWSKDKPDLNRGVLAYNVKGKRTGFWVGLDLGSAPDVGAAIDNSPSASNGTASNGSSDSHSSALIVPPAPGLKTANSEASRSVLGWSLIAFIGGLILNIMPCVFPVISLKALSVAKAGHGELKVIRREAWAYTLGILVSFILMAILVLALKAGGNAVGWAFHFQDPRVVALLALLLFAIGLNLLGFFEIAGGFQNAGQDLTRKSGWSGSFFTGVLAVIVATPCMAPFMGTSIAAALAETPVNAAVIFIALGLGFALPFLLIAYIPAISRALPRPGDWMVTFKEILAFPMFATVVWLIWIISGQSGDNGVGTVLAALVFVGFAVWLLKREKSRAKLFAGMSILAAFALAFTLHAKPVEIRTVDLSTADGGPVYGAPWSPENVAKLRADGYSVFVDFTANWCINCKVNELRVLKQDDVKLVFKETNTAFLIADWTARDAVIANEIERHGRVGIPLYLLYPAGNDAVSPEILPQSLTKNMVREALKRNSQ